MSRRPRPSTTGSGRPCSSCSNRKEEPAMTMVEARPQAAALEDYPRYPLLFGPSPIQRLNRLEKHLGGATLWAKREDCNSPYAFGGNKTRKLEYLVAEALAQGCDTLVSIGN